MSLFGFLKKLKIVHIPIVLMLFAGAAMIGLTDYLLTDYDSRRLLQAEFINNVVTTNVGIILLITSILLILVDKYKDENELYKEIEKNITRFYREEYLSPVWRQFTKIENRKRKKEAYLDVLNTKMDELKPNDIDLIIYYKKLEDYKNEEEYKSARFENKYCRKMDSLKLRLDNMEQDLENIKVSYDTISEQLIFTGCATNEETKNYIHKRKWVTVTRDLAPRILFGIAFIIFITGFLIDFNDQITAAMIQRTFIKLFVVTSQIYYAVDYSKKYNEQVTLGDIQFRWDIINTYRAWFTTVRKELNGHE